MSLEPMREARGEKGRFVPGAPGPALRHGLRSATLLDQPEMAEAFAEKVRAIETDLGSDLSTLKASAVREAARLSLIVDSLGSDLLARGVMTPKGNTRAALSAYTMAFDRLQKLMALLGLERTPKGVPALQSYIAERQS